MCALLTAHCLDLEPRSDCSTSFSLRQARSLTIAAAAIELPSLLYWSQVRFLSYNVGKFRPNFSTFLLSADLFSLFSGLYDIDRTFHILSVFDHMSA